MAAGQGDPISRWVRYYRRRTAAEAAESLAALATLAGGKPSVCLDSLLDDIDGSLATPADDASLDERLADVGKTVTADFAAAIGAQVGQAFQPDVPCQAGKPDLPARHRGDQSLEFFPPCVRGAVRPGLPARDGRRRSACR